MGNLTLKDALQENARATKYWLNKQLVPINEEISELDKSLALISGTFLQYDKISGTGTEIENNKKAMTAVVDKIGGLTYNPGNILPFNTQINSVDPGWECDGSYTNELYGIKIEYVRALDDDGEVSNDVYKSHTIKISGTCTKTSTYFIFRKPPNDPYIRWPAGNSYRDYSHQLTIRISPAPDERLAPIVGYYIQNASGSLYDSSSHAWNGYTRGPTRQGVLANGNTYVEYDVSFNYEDYVSIHSIRLRFNVHSSSSPIIFDNTEYTISVGYKNNDILEPEYFTDVENSYVQKINNTDIIPENLIQHFPWLSYGKPDGSLYNYIDFENKKAYKFMDVLYLKQASITHTAYSSTNNGYATHTFKDQNGQTIKIKKIIMCSSLYPIITYHNRPRSGAYMWLNNTNGIEVSDIRYTRSKYDGGWKDYLSNNKIWVLVELQEPEVYDISDYLTGYDKYKTVELVEGSNKIITNNPITRPMPYTLTTVSAK